MKTKLKSSANKFYILFSFAHILLSELNKLSICKGFDRFDIIMDCGAFTKANAKYKERYDRVQLNAYIDYCHRIKCFKNIRYVSMDVLGDPKKTFDNYYAMLKEGLSPCPVWTYGMSLKYLEKYLTEQKEDVFIGNIQGKKIFKVIPLLKQFPEYLSRLHLFGINRLQLVRDLKVSSLDNSELSNNLKLNWFPGRQIYLQDKTFKLSIASHYKTAESYKKLQHYYVHTVDKLKTQNSNFKDLAAVIENTHRLFSEKKRAYQILNYYYSLQIQQLYFQQTGIKLYLAGESFNHVLFLKRDYHYQSLLSTILNIIDQGVDEDLVIGF